MAEAVEWKKGDKITSDKLSQMQQVPGPQGKPGTNGKDGAPGPKGIGVKSLSLKADASGKITGGTLTTTDDKTSSVAVTQEAEKPAE